MIATEKVELTKLKLDNLRPAPRGERYEVADTHISGLRVRIGDAAVEGGKFRGKAAQINFVLLARFPSKPNPNPTRRTLGNYAREFPELTLEAARQKAIHWKAMIKAGLDPSLESKRERDERDAAKLEADEAARKLRSVRDVLGTYAHDRLSQLRRGEATRRALDGREGLLRDLLENDVKNISRQDIADAVRARAEVAPVSAKEAVELLINAIGTRPDRTETVGESAITSAIEAFEELIESALIVDAEEVTLDLFQAELINAALKTRKLPRGRRVLSRRERQTQSATIQLAKALSRKARQRGLRADVADEQAALEAAAIGAGYGSTLAWSTIARRMRNKGKKPRI